MNRLESYAESKVSQIERIMRSSDDDVYVKMVRGDVRVGTVVPVVHVRPEIKRNVQRINNFFSIEEPRLSIDQKK